MGGAHLGSHQEEAGAAQLPVHLQEPLGGGVERGFVLCAQPVPQGLHLPQQGLPVGAASSDPPPRHWARPLWGTAVMHKPYLVCGR